MLLSGSIIAESHRGERPLRVAIVGLSHESNTFLVTPTRREDFDVHVGEAVRERRSGTHHEIAGYLDGLAGERVEAVPVFDAVAMPGGRITGAAFEALTSELLAALAAAGPFDGVLAAAHGAAVAGGYGDADGHWLGALRRVIGADVPLVVTTDAHANLTPAMLAASDALIPYRTNPHLDTHERGLEAAALIVRTLRGEIGPVQAGAFPPLAINILLQDPGSPPCRPLYELAEDIRARPGILSASIALGFPYADVPEVGTSFCVVADADESLAAAAADELASALLERRDAFVPELIAPAAAVERAATAPGPVCLLDMGDNVGGGSAADGTTLAHIVLERGGPSAFIALFDPEVAASAHELGVGAEAVFTIGGKTDDLHGPPIEVRAGVRSLHDGRFTESLVRHGAADRFDMGPTAILDTDRGLTIQVTSERVLPFSIGQLTSCGIDPSDHQVLVAKGVHAPLPAYAPVCPTIIRADTPGSTTADMGKLPFEHRRVPLFPLEPLPDAHG